MNEVISDQHRQRQAVVYIRQSTSFQVANNQESYRIQRRLKERAIELGWPKSRVTVIEGDLGCSAASPGQRKDFKRMVRLIQDQEVGIVFALDASRLARNDLDWCVLMHWCSLFGVLIGEQDQVYDPAKPQDKLILGIQGVLAMHELSVIHQRMRLGTDEKASRGELHVGARIPGYVVIDKKHLRKDPDKRVQQSVQRVFEKFETCSSVVQLWNWMEEHEVKLPKTNGNNTTWRVPCYGSLTDMLKNPKYAGIYVYPRRVYKSTSKDGVLKRVERLALVDEWKIVLEDQHPAYISVNVFHENQKKIAMNAQRHAHRSAGAAHKGASLIAGLIRCRQCDHKMHVHYSRSNMTYYCNKGLRQRSHGGAACLRFSSVDLELQLSEQVLHAISPAGIIAADLAAQRMASERERRRQQIAQELTRAEYEADLTRRRFNNVDPANRLLFDTLADELEIALQQVEEERKELKSFDQFEPQCPTDEQRAQLQSLGQSISTVWHDEKCDNTLKKEIVRILVDHIYAEVDEASGEIVLTVKWSGGHHTSLRSSTKQHRCNRSDKLNEKINTLRKLYDDESIALALNRSKIKNANNESWTSGQVKQFRRRHDIPKYSKRTQQSHGWISQADAATRLGISPMSVSRLIQQRILPAEAENGLPSVIEATDLENEVVQTVVKRIKSNKNAPLPTDPNQLSLFK